MISEYYPHVDKKMCQESLWNVSFNRNRGITRMGKTCVNTNINYIYDYRKLKKSIEIEHRKLFHADQWETQVSIFMHGHDQLKKTIAGYSIKSIIKRTLIYLQNTEFKGRQIR